MNAMNDDYLSVPQIAQVLGKSEPTVRRAIRRGALPAYQFGERGYSVAVSDLESFIARSRRSGRPASVTQARPPVGRCVRHKAERVVGEAAERVIARYSAIGTPDAALDSGGFFREVVAEACLELDRQRSRSLRRARKAVKRAAAADRQLSAVSQLPAAADPDLIRFHGEVAAWLQRRAAAAEAAPAAGPPPWHPEHRSNPGSE